MSNIRKAYSVEIIDRRLGAAEAAGGAVDRMELVGLHDELARVERKWVEKATAARPNGRPLADPVAINARFDRLTRLVAAALRQPGGDPPERALLQTVADRLRDRTPLPTAAGEGNA